MTTKRKVSWSNSTLNLYEQCAFKYMCVKIAKIPEEASIYLIKGLAAHELAEKFLLGEIDELPTVLDKFKTEFTNLRKYGAKAEEAITFNDKWEHIPDGWVHEEAWLRMKLDARLDSLIIDFKTGKHYTEHINQARLYANAYMLIDSEPDSVDVEFWYLKDGFIKHYTFYRKDLEADLANWQARVDRMVNDTEYKPTINAYCKYCHVKNVCPAQVGK